MSFTVFCLGVVVYLVAASIMVLDCVFKKEQTSWEE